jgi:beta-phosphoglucomutase family hydrolase
LTAAGPAGPAAASTRIRLPAAIRACLFDLDGVLTDTATVHAAAWKEMFDEYLRRRAERDRAPFVPFDADRDYHAYVDGKQRYDGVRSFLASRGIEVPEGSPSDAPGRETIQGLANSKNELVVARLRGGGVVPFPGSLRFVEAVRAAGLACAVVSASANCRDVLRSAGIEELFETRVDGVVAAELGLRGKPAPDTFLEAARRLGAAPPAAAVLEDAIAGVEAGRAGGFGLVVGVERGLGEGELRRHGADLVVGDLAELLAE